MVDLLDIGGDLVARRRALGVSQRELGECVGVAQPQIARWESTCYHSASLEKVGAVARALRYELTPTLVPLAAEQASAYTSELPGTHAEALAALSRVPASPAAIAAFARSHGVVRMDLFGSILTREFRGASDVDVLVTYEPGRRPSLLDAFDHQTELEAIFRRRVDLVSRAGLESSGNAARKRDILRSARTLYARP